MTPLPSAILLAAALFAPAASRALPQEARQQDPPIPADADPRTTASGLRYSVLAPGGPGARPKLGDLVVVHYTGWLADGKVFDSSSRRGEPAEFILGQVIPGWNEGLQLMSPGARFKLTIPPDLGYGQRGAPPAIPPGATLIFEVELLEVVAAPPFHPADPDAQKTTASGLRYQPLVEGAGEPAAADDMVEVKFAFWNTSGKLLQCSETSRNTLKGRAADMRLAFLKEALPMLRPGARYRFEVPPALCFGARAQGPDLPANSVTVWELELVRVIQPLPLPAFSLPAEGARATASGLKYEVVKEGSGATPRRGEAVTVHYAGWLTDGTLFDSSYDRGEPSTFQLGQVIDGWNEGLALMREGAVYRFLIPPELAYGASGAPPKIGPNATLVFLVELVKVGSGGAP